jgi:hypothetical protein
MFLFRALLLFGLMFALTADITAADKKKKGGVTGVVISVTEDKDNKDNGVIKIKVMAGKKDKNTAGEEKSFKYNKDTRYWKAEGKKNEVAAVLADIVKDTKVVIQATGDTADKVTILPGKKK